MHKSLGAAGAKVCFAILFIIAARVLGQDDWGTFTYASSLAALSSVGLDPGLNTLTIRDGSRHPEKLPYYAGTVLLIKGCLAVLVLALVWGFCSFKGYEGLTLTIIMTMAGLECIAAAQQFGIAGLNALECMDKEAVSRILNRLTALLACGAALLCGLGLMGMVGGLIVANLFGAGLALRFFSSRTSFKLNLQKGFLGYLMKEALPLAMTSIFILIYFRIDIIMLESFGQSMASIGWYGAGVRLIDALGILPGLVSLGLFPVLSSMAHKDPQGMRRLYEQGQSLLLILGIPAAVGLYILRSQVVELVFGTQFLPTIKVFVWLAPVLAMLFVNFIQLRMLTVLNKQRLNAISTGICVLVNVGFNLILIPRYGFVGAAAATLITETALMTLCALFLHRQIGSGLRIFALAWRPALAAGIMWAALAGLGFWLADTPPAVQLALMVPAGGLIYFGALIRLGGISIPQLRRLFAIARGSTQPGTAGA